MVYNVYVMVLLFLPKDLEFGLLETVHHSIKNSVYIEFSNHKSNYGKKTIININTLQDDAVVTSVCNNFIVKLAIQVYSCKILEHTG